jgi:hypothetical protein
MLSVQELSIPQFTTGAWFKLDLDETQEKQTDPIQIADAVVTFEKYARSWLISSDRQNDTTQHQLSTFRSIIKRWVIPRFGAMPVDKITSVHVKQFGIDISKHQSDGTKLAPKTVANMIHTFLFVLKSAGRQISRADIADKRIAKRVWGDTNGCHCAVPVGTISAILNAVNPLYRNYTALRLYAGLDTMEAQELLWSDVDIASGTITIRCQATTLVPRTIELCDEALEVLKAHAQVNTTNGSRLVFTSQYGKPIDNANFIHRVWMPVAKQLGLTTLTPRDFHYTAAAIWRSKGKHPLWVCEALGRMPSLPNIKRYTDLKFLPEIQSIPKEMPAMPLVENSAKQQEVCADDEDWMIMFNQFKAVHAIDKDVKISRSCKLGLWIAEQTRMSRDGTLDIGRRQLLTNGGFPCATSKELKAAELEKHRLEKQAAKLQQDQQIEAHKLERLKLAQQLKQQALSELAEKAKLADQAAKNALKARTRASRRQRINQTRAQKLFSIATKDITKIKENRGNCGRLNRLFDLLVRSGRTISLVKLARQPAGKFVRETNNWFIGNITPLWEPTSKKADTHPLLVDEAQNMNLMEFYQEPQSRVNERRAQHQGPAPVTARVAITISELEAGAMVALIGRGKTNFLLRGDTSANYQLEIGNSLTSKFN